MVSDSDSSSSSELDDAPLGQDVEGSDSVLSLGAENMVPGDSESGSQDNTPSSPPEQEPPRPVTMTARAYQREMLEESLKQNIIVAMDTGSGKTQVAILRIQADLERNEKIVWFLAPTVALAQQQFEVIQAQIPGVQSKFICGDNDVSAWSSQPGVWDKVLLNTRIVVSTYQILFDAVSHALVPLSSLGLIVIDEAHNCVKMNSVARLMREHYSPTKAKGQPVPHMLGLTASPVMRSNLSDLGTLERTLDAVCKTPSRHRDELMAQVNRPEMETVQYRSLPEPEGAGYPTPTMAKLRKAYLELDIDRDPLILKLLADNTSRGRDTLRKVYMMKKTYCQVKMKSFCARAHDICKHLGPWAADYYIHKAIATFLNNLESPNEQADTLANRESRYLAETLMNMQVSPPPPVPTALSAKMKALVDTLESHQDDPVGIIFVKDRATVAVVSHILSVHPRIRARYRVGSMVGTSKVPGRRKEFLDLSRKEDLLSLYAFRTGSTNLLVATSVLEEGIDVPACNLVVCFDEPDNLKSFIQRRGRARMSVSKLYLLVEEGGGSSKQWQALEQEMKRKYEDDMRENKQLEEIESSEALDYPVLRDEETGAQITIHDAAQHLEHFCASLSSQKFVDWCPVYVVHDLEGNPVDPRNRALRKATVHLPVSLAPQLRRFESLRAWPSESNARKDAAFQAYAKLREAGLLDRNLLPIRKYYSPRDSEQQRAGLIRVPRQLDPWPAVAQAWRGQAVTYRRRMTISSRDTSARAEFELELPVEVPWMEQFVLHWDRSSSWLVSMEPDGEIPQTNSGPVRGADVASTMIKMAFGHRSGFLKKKKQYVVGFVCLDQDIRVEHMGATEISAELMENVSSTHLVRHIVHGNHPYFYQDLLSTDPSAKPSADLAEESTCDIDAYRGPYVALKAWPRHAGRFRRDAIKSNDESGSSSSSRPYTRVVPANQVRVDSIPAVYTQVGMLLPAITYTLGIHLVAKNLLETHLETTGITNVSLVAAAITSSAAGWAEDYERLEFLGDSILKFCAVINCSAQHPKYPEGFLSALKDRLVSNSRLCVAAEKFGLSRYIIFDPLNFTKWRPLWVEDLLASQKPGPKTRMMSTKVLADVVEALIGASFVSGGTPKALACLSVFMPEERWESIERGREILYNEAPHDEALPVTMRQLESLIGYTFTKKSLLVEAMTHPSYNNPGVRASFDRLEFLGDAILDYVVVNKLFAVNDPRPLSNAKLSQLRAALVNADILGFFVLECSIDQERVDVDADAATAEEGDMDVDDGDTDKIRLVRSQTRTPLWSFLRHASLDMGAIQRATSRRHARLRAKILKSLWDGRRYPWDLLSKLGAPKFCSDLFESLLGAVWVDSGSMEECEKVVERMGILPLMGRILRDGLHTMHPVEELGILAHQQQEKVKYEIGPCRTAARFRCRVQVGDKVVAKVRGCVHREHAKIKGAMKAIKVLKKRKKTT